MKIRVQRRHLRIYAFVTLLHASPGGSPVLRGQASWRTINGVMLNSRRLRLHGWLLFRRTSL